MSEKNKKKVTKKKQNLFEKNKNIFSKKKTSSRLRGEIFFFLKKRWKKNIFLKKKKEASKLSVLKNEHFQFCPHKIIGNGTFPPPTVRTTLTKLTFFSIKLSYRGGGGKVPLPMILCGQNWKCPFFKTDSLEAFFF